MVYVRAILLALFALPAVAEEVPLLWAPPSQFPPTLRDIAGRLPRDTDARDADLITYAHEGSHFLCRGKPGYHCVYIGGGRRWEIPTPPLVTEEVFARIPKEHRTSIYPIYLRQGRDEYWAAQPLMILDEWRAYTVGSQTRHAIRVAARRETITHMETFTQYAKVLYELAKELEGYDIAEMRAFCRWNLDECRSVPGFQTDVDFD